MIETEIKKLTSAVTELTAALHTVRLPAETQTQAPELTSEKPSDELKVAPAPDSAKTDAKPATVAADAKAPVSDVSATAPAAVDATEAALAAAGVAAAAAAVIPAAAAPAAAAEVPAPDVPPVVAVPTKKQLVDKFILLAQEKDRNVAIALLAEFGVSKLPELKDKAQWAPFVAKIDALLAA